MWPLSCAPRAAVAQLARASACHAEGRGFESHQPLSEKPRVCGAFRSRRGPPGHDSRHFPGRVLNQSPNVPSGERPRAFHGLAGGCPQASRNHDAHHSRDHITGPHHLLHRFTPPHPPALNIQPSSISLPHLTQSLITLNSNFPPPISLPDPSDTRSALLPPPRPPTATPRLGSFDNTSVFVEEGGPQRSGGPPSSKAQAGSQRNNLGGAAACCAQERNP